MPGADGEVALAGLPVGCVRMSARCKRPPTGDGELTAEVGALDAWIELR